MSGKNGQKNPIRVSSMRLGGEELSVLSFPIPSAARLDVLSPAEKSVAEGIISGLSNGEIAEERGTSPRTVANQVASIFRKLKVASRAQVALLVSGVRPAEEMTMDESC